MKKRLSKSLRKFIRLEKARIRRQVLDLKKQEELINELYQRLLKTGEEDKSSSSPSPRFTGLGK